MDTTRTILLVRADFLLGPSEGGDRLMLKRWRSVLAGVLPRLMGCSDRAPTAERVRLREGEPAGRFSAWLRLSVARWPSRRRLRKLRARLLARLEAALLPVGGRVLKLGVRRYRGKPLQPALPEVRLHQPDLPFPDAPAESPTAPALGA